MEIEKRLARPIAKGLLRAIKAVQRPDLNLQRLGTRYGGWKVPGACLRRGNVAMCVGAGEDISFDVELNRMGLRVISVDPTPRAIEHIQGVIGAARNGARYAINRSNSAFYNFDGFDLERFEFAPFGAWSHAATLKFYAPQDPEHVSHSVVNLQGSKTFFEAQCDRISVLMQRYDIDHLDILKLDIEGAEYVVIEDIIQSKVLPRCLLVEFDEFHSPKGIGFIIRLFRAYRELKKAGYRLADAEAGNFCFMRP